MSNLDDFFKKRDKKKKATTKSKFDTLSTDALAKNLKVSNDPSSSSSSTLELFGTTTKTDNNEKSTVTTKSSIDSATTVIDTSPKVAEIDDDTVYVAPELAITTAAAATATATATKKNKSGEEEWKPFDEGDNRDYTGLRINTQGWKVEDDEEENLQGGGESNEVETPSNVWGAKKKQQQQQQLADQEEANQENDDKETKEQTAAAAAATAEDKNKEETAEAVEEKRLPAVVDKQETKAATLETPKKEKETPGPAPAVQPYIPPSMRISAAAASSEPPKPPAPSSSESSGSAAPYVAPSLRHRTANQQEPTLSHIPASSVNYRRPKKELANLSDTMEFPSLGGMGSGDDSTQANGSSNQKFEMPKKSAKGETKVAAAMIDVENKFSMLGNN